jgi:hypothetical protein
MAPSERDLATSYVACERGQRREENAMALVIDGPVSSFVPRVPDVVLETAPRSVAALCDSYGFVDDLLTSVLLYPFGAAGVPHLVISRPSSLGISVLSEYGQPARAFLKEFPPRHQCAEFPVCPEEAAILSRLIRERQAQQEKQFACLGGNWQEQQP